MSPIIYVETLCSFHLCWYKYMVFRPRFCLLHCAHASPIKMNETDRHSLDHICASNFYVILYLFVYHYFFSGKRWGKLRHVLCLESHREFSNIIFSDWVCVLNVTMWLLKAVCFSYFQDPSFLNNIFPISRPNCWWLLKRHPREWEWKVAYLKNGLTSITEQYLKLRCCMQLWDMSFYSEVLLQAIPKASLPPVLTLICLNSKLFPVCFVLFSQHQQYINLFHSLNDPKTLFM